MRWGRARVVAVAGGAAWLVVALVLWASAAPLGHDEAQYVLAARDTLAGEPPRWIYLSQGMNLLAVPGVWLGGSEHAVRALPVLAGLGFLIAAWLVARRALGEVAAAGTVWVLAGTRQVVKWSADLLSDLPAAGLLLLALALVVDELDRPEGPRWRLAAVGPICAAAVYVRYGSVLPIAVIALATLAVGARALARRPGPALAAGALFALALAPHVLASLELTGRPLGILLEGRSVPSHAYVGEGLVTYLTANPLRMYGALAPAVMLAGVVAGARALGGADRRRALVWLVAVGTLVALGLTTHAQPRYVVLAIALLVALGVDALARGLARLPATPRRALAAVAVAALGLVWASQPIALRRIDEGRRARLAATLRAIDAIRADAAGRPCRVLGDRTLQLEWYTGCRSSHMDDPDAAVEGHARGERVYAVVDASPAGAGRAQVDITRLPGSRHDVLARPEVRVVRVDPSAPVGARP